MAWYTDVDNDGLYEMTVGQDGGVVANPNSSYLFADMSWITGLENLYTTGVTDMSYTFHGCESLSTAPTIPNGVTNMSSTFRGCTSLMAAPIIPNTVINMSSTFMGCTSLETVQTISNSVTNMSFTFDGCKSLTTAPAIPNSVTNMDGTFDGCTSLKKPPRTASIADSVLEDEKDSHEVEISSIGKSAADEVLDDDDYSFDSGEVSYNVPDRDDEER